ncbi:MAG: ABC transporter substrate-binding protein [Ilumatobacteraceae bacterium]
MRRNRTLAVAVCLSIGATACGSGSSSDSADTTAAPDTGTTPDGTAPDGTTSGTTSATTPSGSGGSCTGDPVTGGSLTYARQLETQTLNPLDIRNGNGDIFADGLIYQGLVRYDPAGGTDIVPGAAESWDIAPDGLTYTFHLRPDLKFSNGDPLTAEDVKFSLDLFGNPETNPVMSVLTTGYASSAVVDPATVEVTLSTPVPAFLDNISTFPASILPEQLVTEQGDAFWNAPVGTGPFMVKEFVSGSKVTFERNPNYWDAGKPYLDEVTFNFAIDGNSRLLSLTSGDVQIADGISPSQIKTVTDNADLVLQNFPTPASIMIFPNFKMPELADQNVRLAMMSALDLNAINDQIFGGLGTVPNSVMQHLKYDAPVEDIPAFAFDLDAAKGYMAASGFPDGFDVKLEYPSGTDYFNQLGLLVQQQLSAIGIKVELLKEDPTTLVTNWAEENHELNFVFPGTSSDVAVPDEYALFFGDPEGNNAFHTGFSDPAITTLVKEFVSNPDEATRATQWPVIQQAFIDQQPIFNLLDVPFLNAYATNVCGTDVNVLGVDQLQNTWLAGDAG